MRKDKKKWVDDDSVEELARKLAVKPREAADMETLERATAAYKEARREARGGREPQVQEVFVRMMGSRALQGAMAAAVLLLIFAGVCLLCQEGADRLAQNGQGGAAAQIALVQKLYETGNVKGLKGALAGSGIEAQIAAANYLALVGDQSAIVPLQKASRQWTGDAAADPFAKAAAAITARAGSGGVASAADVNGPPAAKVAQTAPAPAIGAIPAAALPAEPNMQTMIVTVIDKATGKPLKGAKVMLGEEGRTEEAVTSDAGLAVVRISPEARRVRMYVGYSHAGYVGLTQMLEPEEAKDFPRILLFRLPKSLTAGGVVLDPERRPIEGVKVTMIRSTTEAEDWSGQAWPIVNESTETEPDGRWKCSSMLADMNNVHLDFEHPKYLRQYVEYSEAAARELLSQSFVTVLQRGTIVYGFVRRTDGSSVAGATVTMDGYRSSQRRTVTDSEGRFELASADDGEGEIILAVKAKNCAPQIKTVPAERLAEPVQFVLEPGRILKGRVVDGTGRGIAGATVRTGYWQGRDDVPGKKATTDPNGRFVLDSLPKDAIQINITRSAASIGKGFTDIVADEDEQVFVVEELLVRGSVTDAKTGEPIAEFRLIPGLAERPRQAVSWLDSEDVVKSFKGGRYEYLFDTAGLRSAIQIRAEGYLAATSREFEPNEKEVLYDFKLKKMSFARSAVLLPDGRPAAGARVYVVKSVSRLDLRDGEIASEYGRPRAATAGADGAFRYSDPGGRYALVAIHDAGIGVVTDDEFGATGRIMLKPWARIEGEYMMGSRPAARRSVEIFQSNFGDDDSADRQIYYNYSKVQTDENGRFVFEKVTPCRSTIRGSHYRIEPGRTLSVKLGGVGRQVTGKIVRQDGSPYDMTGKHASIEVEKPDDGARYVSVPWPADANTMSSEQLTAWVDKWRQSKEYEDYWRQMYHEQEATRRIDVQVSEDGAFAAEDVESGRWVLYGKIRPGQWVDVNRDRYDGTACLEFEMPPVDETNIDIPFDLGQVRLLPPRPKVGDIAPAFDLEGTDRNRVRLSDYPGKVVLVLFTAGKSDTAEDLANLRTAFDMFRGREDFQMLGIIVGSKRNAITRAMSRERSVPWPQGFTGPSDTRLRAEYGWGRGSLTVLIDRDGRVLALGLRGEELIGKIEQVLAK